MKGIIEGISILGLIVGFFSFAIAGYINIWIYYSTDKKKYPLFPILNPFSFSTYELISNSIFTFAWDITDKNQKLKRRSNYLRKFSGKMIIIGVIALLIKTFFFT